MPTAKEGQFQDSREEISLDLGLYVNLFEVKFEDCEIDLMCVERRQFSDLRPLRRQLEERGIQARVHAVEGDIYGYGPDQAQLEKFGFEKARISFAEIPSLTSRFVLEGYVDSLRDGGYTCFWSFGRAIAYRFDKAVHETQTGVRLFRGFELQSMYLFNQETENLVYCILVNPVFTYRDSTNKRLSTHEIVARFGSDTLRQLRTKQGDLAPMGKINLEVSRQRLMDLIMPFVNVRHEFTLPCGIPAELSLSPIRVVLSAEE